MFLANVSEACKEVIQFINKLDKKDAFHKSYCLFYACESIKSLLGSVLQPLCTLFLVLYYRMFTNYSSREAESGTEQAFRYVWTRC